MCGINGIVDIKRTLDIQELNDKINTMNNMIIHRGPDDTGVFIQSNKAIGMRRLSIIDLKTGHQPIFNEDQTMAIVLNGEIYNYKDVRSRLKSKGHQFRTNSDTETVLHAFEEYGEGCVKYFDGMFAFCIYNTVTEELFIYRDRAGEKPLYYYIDENYFIFASEMKSILSTKLVPKNINPIALRQYFCLTYIPAPMTIFKDIFKLEAGNYIKYRKGKITISAYWNVNYSAEQLISDYDECKAQLRETLFKSVENRMVADVPIGSFLSGGIDSTIITGIMSKLSDKPISTFTIGFKEKQYDESNRALIASKFHNTQHHMLELDYDYAIDILDTVVNNIDEPFADSSQIPTYVVSKLAADHVKVILTGDAGDELFAGYNKYLISYYADLYKRVPGWIRRVVFEKIINSLPDKGARMRKIKKVIDLFDKNNVDQRLGLMSGGFKISEMKKLLINEKQNEIGELIPVTELCSKCGDMLDEITKTLYLDFKIVLEGDMLTKVDRNSMLASLETRVPMLSRDMIELAFMIPSKYKINKRNRKIILKDTFSDLIPKELIKASKKGFAVPVDYWFRNELKGELLSLIDKEFIEKQGLFNYEYLKQVCDEHFSGTRNRKGELWCIYVFQKWYKNYM